MEELIPETPEVVETVEDKKPLLPAWTKYIFIALGLAAVVMYLLASGWGGYAFAYVKCGIKQPILAYTIENSRLYYTPDNRRYSAPGEGVLFNGYYCTEPQAVAAGYLRAGP